MLSFQYSRLRDDAASPPAQQISKVEPALKRGIKEKPRILIIGAGYRGYSYAEPIHTSGEGIIAAVAEPSEFKRQAFGERFIWGAGQPAEGQAFSTWEDFISYELNRRKLENNIGPTADPGIDAVFVCLLDELHATVVGAMAPLGLHILCEKPLATRLNDLLGMYGSLLASWEKLKCQTIFSAGLVLRYSLPQVMLRKIVREDRAIGDVISVEHTEAVGWKHFEHCYVRCPIETSCQYSAKSLYLHQHLRAGNSDRPVNAIVPDIEDVLKKQGLLSAANRLLDALGEDYDEKTPVSQVKRRNWFGRCVWDSDNDVCDDQMVTIEWDSDNVLPSRNETDVVNRYSSSSEQMHVSENLDSKPQYRPAKIARFHMVALTDAISRRRGRISGTAGEISYDSATICVKDFRTGSELVYNIPSTKRGHDGGDDGLALSFVRAVAKVRHGEMMVLEAQKNFLKCTVEELFRSHLAVFWIEEARRKGATLTWREWWEREVETKLKGMGVKIDPTA